jgi:hypothetical protein
MMLTPQQNRLAYQLSFSGTLVTMSYAKFLRRLSIGIMWLTSAYVLLMLLIALTDQGQPTGAFNGADLSQLFYPVWYANPDVITAVRLAVVAYPTAALAYGLAVLLSYAATDRPVPPRLYSEAPAGTPTTFGGLADPFAPAGPLPEPGPGAPAAIDQTDNPDYLCILDTAFLIRAISRNAAAILGFAPEALLHRPFTNFVMAADIAQIHATSDRLTQDPQAVIGLHLHIRHPDEIAVEADAICRAGLGADGRIISMTLIPRSERGPLSSQLAAIWY